LPFVFILRIGDVDDFLGFQTTFQAEAQHFGTMENVAIAVGDTSFDAQVAIGVGAFGLHGERMGIVLLHGDAAVQ